MDSQTILTLAFLMCFGRLVQAGVVVRPPAWSEGTETTSIGEDAAIGSQVTVTTTAINSPDTVTILETSIGANAQTLFNAATDGTNVQLTTAGALDRETTAQYVLHLRASNSAGDTSTEANYGDLQLTVNINDVNDNNPVFSTVSTCMAVPADAAGSTSVETMVATDADAGSNALGVSPYSFLASQTLFDISGNTGEVTVKAGQTLPAGAYNLQIIATDGGSPAKSATATLTVCAGTTCCGSCTDGCSSSVRHIPRGVFLAFSLTAFALYLKYV